MNVWPEVRNRNYGNIYIYIYACISSCFRTYIMTRCGLWDTIHISMCVEHIKQEVGELLELSGGLWADGVFYFKFQWDDVLYLYTHVYLPVNVLIL